MKSIMEKLSLRGDEKIRDFPKKFNELLRIIERLVNAVSLLFGIVAGFIGQALFSGKLAQVFHFFDIDWNQLSEGYQLLFIGAPLTLIVTVVGHFINKKYIDPLFQKEAAKPKG